MARREQKNATRKPEIVERVVENIDLAKADEIFRKFDVPEEKRRIGTERLLSIVAHVRIFEKDLEVEKIRDPLGKRPQDQRKHFLKLAKQLEKVADAIADLDKPRERFLHDLESGTYIPPVGSYQFRVAMAGQFAEILTTEFIKTFGVEPRKFAPTDAAKKAINIENKAEAIIIQAIPISREILQRVARGMREAEAALKEQTRSGARRNLIRDAVLLNLVGLWNDCFDGKKGVYVDDANRALFDFCESLCLLLGVPGFCSDWFINAATQEFIAIRDRKVNAAPQRSEIRITTPTKKNPQNVQTYVGTVVWRMDAVSRAAGPAATVILDAHIQIPDAKLWATMTMEKNWDTKLHASHTVTWRFLRAGDSPIPEIAEDVTLQMRDETSANVDPLIAAPAHIAENIVIIALASGDAPIKRNLELLENKAWFDLLFRAKDRRIVKISIEKGSPGKKIMGQALSSWRSPQIQADIKSTTPTGAISKKN